jgi:hypothetical protein
VAEDDGEGAVARSYLKSPHTMRTKPSTKPLSGVELYPGKEKEALEILESKDQGRRARAR